MARVTLQQTESGWQTAGPACVGCRGCGVKAVALDLPLPSGVRKADLELTTSDQLLLLLNSWLAPVLLVVLAAVLCRSAALPEMLSIVMILLSFCGGIVLCRRLPVTVLKISENTS